MEYIRLSQINLAEHIGERLFLKFMVRNVDIRKQKDGVTDFITFNMADKDFSVECRLFGATQSHMDIVKEGAVCIGAIDIKPYAKSSTGYSCIVYNVDYCSENSRDYISWTDGIEEGYKVIYQALYDTVNTVYGKITYDILTDKWDKFATWTAAKSMHHNALGGLLVHTSEVVSLVTIIGNYFNSIYGDNFIDMQLVKCGALLHDWGKIGEYDVDLNSGATAYSVDACLESHIMSIISEVEIAAYKNDFGYQTYTVDNGVEKPCKTDEQIRREIEQVKLLKHLVGSHHGKLEWGSPITPSVPEAYILHVMDNMSAEMFKYNKEFKSLEPGDFSSSWQNDGAKIIYKDTSK